MMALSVAVGACAGTGTPDDPTIHPAGDSLAPQAISPRGGGAIPGPGGAAGSLSFSLTGGSPSDDAPFAIAADGFGNSVTVGYFGGTIDLGCGPRTAVGTWDMYVAKHGSAGACAWMATAGGAGDMTFATGVALDAGGNVYVAGGFGTSIDFGGGTAFTAVGGWDGFLARYDAAGTLAWAERFGGPDDEYPIGVATNGMLVAITGAFRGTTALGATATPLASKGEGDVFVAGYRAATGLYQWSHAWGNVDEDAPTAIAMNGTKIVVSGAYQDTIDFGAAGRIASAGSYDGMIVSFDLSGIPTAASSVGGADFDAVASVAIDAQTGSVVAGGYFGAAAHVGAALLTGAGSLSGFVARYDAALAPQWSKAIDATDHAIVSSVAVDSAGDVVISGEVGGTSTLGFASAGTTDLMVAKLLGDGSSVLWTDHYGAQGTALASILAIGQGDQVLTGGVFDDQIDVPALVTSHGGYDIVLLSIVP